VQINEAYQTLKNPITRAQYLLSLRGVNRDAQKETTSDTLFLMEQMELREALEQIPHNPEPESALDEMLQQVSGMIKAHIAKMAVALESQDQKSIEEACEMIRKLQFLNKLYFEIETVEEQLEAQF
jgi:molecular chaperone HscB